MDIRDLTTDEFKSLVREAVAEALDPDSGLELRPEVVERLGPVDRAELLTLDAVRQRRPRSRA